MNCARANQASAVFESAGSRVHQPSHFENIVQVARSFASKRYAFDGRQIEFTDGRQKSGFEQAAFKKQTHF
jgi:hypothetical protein